MIQKTNSERHLKYVQKRTHKKRRQPKNKKKNKTASNNLKIGIRQWCVWFQFRCCILLYVICLRLVVQVNFGIEIVCVVYAHIFTQSSENKYPVDFHWQKSKLSILLDDDNDKEAKKLRRKKTHAKTCIGWTNKTTEDDIISAVRCIHKIPNEFTIFFRNSGFLSFILLSHSFDLLLIFLSLATFVIPIRLSFPSSYGNL